MRRLSDLRPPARAFVVAVIAAAVSVPAVAALVQGVALPDGWLLAAAALACAAGNLFEVLAPGSYALQPNLAVFFGAALLLPPWATVLVAVAAFLPGLVIGRAPWFKASFNMANYALAGGAARLVVIAAHDPFAGVAGAAGQSVAILVAAAIAFAFVNHLLIVAVVCLETDVPVRRKLDQLAKGLPLDVALAITGGSLVVLWNESPALVVLAAAPLAAVYRALALPALEHQAEQAAVELAAKNAELQAVNDQLVKHHMGTLRMMVQSVAARDRMTGRHSAAVSRYVVALSASLRLPPEQQALARAAGLLHDVGKHI